MVEKRELDYAKESGEALKFAFSVAKHFVEGKSASELAALLPELMEAATGADQVDNEWRENKMSVLNAAWVEASGFAQFMLDREAAAEQPSEPAE